MKRLLLAVTFCLSFDSIKAADDTEEVVTISYRAAVGHTHTCSACGETWDHAANAGHECLNCKANGIVSVQTWQDRVSRPVTVRTRTRVKVPPVARIQSPPIARVAAPVVRVVEAVAPPIANVAGVVVHPVATVRSLATPTVSVQTGVSVSSPCANGACATPARGRLGSRIFGW